MGKNPLQSILSNQRVVAFLAFIGLFLFFCVFGDNFATYPTFVSILDASNYIGFLAIGVTFVIITGGIDLSIGTVMVCSALISGQLIKMGYPVGLCLVLCVVIGGAFGLLNGIMVTVADALDILLTVSRLVDAV